MSVIRIEDIAHVRFTAPDLGEMQTWQEQFGLQVADRSDKRLFMRGRGGAPFLHATELGEPGFAGIGFRAAGLADLETLAAAEGVAVEPLDAPGGGFVVRLSDPDGHAVEVVAGQTFTDPEAFSPRQPWNGADGRARLRTVKRMERGPANVIRLGHAVLNVSNFRASEAWYKARFGFITSDEIALSPEFSLGAFLRCDRGDTPTDHHTLFLFQNPKGPGFNHAAFEVRDLDDLMAGHDHLKSASRTPAWGVGRHVLGSQVFDYWADPWGHVLEHWTDGDLLTAADGSNVVPITELVGVQWGPPPGPAFG
ncbi:MAG: VOC family protein [Caulobacter sp.]|nr:VOC family protein [Caulobacter sp.]